ncbi:acetylornithine deacetylase [Atopomonas sediminilitoris]|uniref:acetylornithine deacetylase n=1 Tax=Atopomonas sediminilitoris TaxID=2919919 RepID=UPI001F4DDC53|nr:acetylornithine deacetylase [Atopomonas sediminilitoris]MCJ8168320.1 acetylornithine deacetylase [Atopomonas sediminilitoris]
MPLPPLKQQFAELIALPSVSCTQPEWDQSNLAVVERLAQWLGELGFVCELQEVEPGKYNLLATLGQGPGGLILAGHTDTVPFDAGRWSLEPLKLLERDNRWYGLGTCDMKGFFPLIIEALQGLPLDQIKRPLMVLATCDEESSMSGARALAQAGKPLPRAAVIGEPTGLRPVRLHKGILMEQVKITGRSGHSSDPSLGHSAMEAMHAAIGRLLHLRGQWQKQFSNPLFGVPTPTLNLGCIHGGDNPNRICAQCALEFDLRPLPGMVAEELRAKIRAELAEVAQEHQVSIDYGPLFPGVPAFEQVAGSPLVKMAERLTGYPAEAVAFATEAPYLQALGCQTIVLGPGDIDCAHQPDEYLALDRIEPTVQLLRGLINECCLSPEDPLLQGSAHA